MAQRKSGFWGKSQIITLTERINWDRFWDHSWLWPVCSCSQMTVCTCSHVGHESVAEQTSLMHSFRPIGLKQGKYFNEEYFTGWLTYVHQRIGSFHTRFGRVEL
jgi:hypothetical protein